jgi:hypothetical protein
MLRALEEALMELMHASGTGMYRTGGNKNNGKQVHQDVVGAQSTELSPHCGLWHLGPMVEAGCDEGQDRLAACPHTTGSLLLASKKALFLDCYLEPFSCDKSGYS